MVHTHGEAPGVAEKNMMRPTAFSEHVVVVLAASAGCGEERAVETAALLRGVALCEILEARRLGYEFCTLQRRSTLLGRLV